MATGACATISRSCARSRSTACSARFRSVTSRAMAWKPVMRSPSITSCICWPTQSSSPLPARGNSQYVFGIRWLTWSP